MSEKKRVRFYMIYCFAFIYVFSFVISMQTSPIDTARGIVSVFVGCRLFFKLSRSMRMLHVPFYLIYIHPQLMQPEVLLLFLLVVCYIFNCPEVCVCYMFRFISCIYLIKPNMLIFKDLIIST